MQINAPYVFDLEPGNALHSMQGNQASFLTIGKSHVFSGFAAGTRVIFSSYGGDGHSKLVFVQRPQDSCLVMMDTLGM